MNNSLQQIENYRFQTPSKTMIDKKDQVRNKTGAKNSNIYL